MPMAPINPFNPYFPAQEPLFANRTQEQAVFRRALAATVAPGSPGPWNMAILGPWGIGKTSLLRRFAAMARDSDPPVAVVTLSVTSSLGGMDGFVALLLQRVREELRGQTRWPARVQQEMARWEPTLTLGPVSVARQAQAPVPAAAALYAELRRLWEGHARGRLAAVGFFLDDVQNLLAVDPGLLLTLRAVFQDLQGIGAVFPLIVTGSEDMFEAARDVAEPVTRFFERVPLGPFSLLDTGAAIRGPLRAAGNPIAVSDEAVRWVQDRSGGHPYFVAFVLREAVDLLRDEPAITPAFLDEHWPAVARRLATEKFSVEYSSATAAEKAVLRAVAAGTALGATGKSGGALAARLVRKGLLSRRARGAYTAYHPLFAEYVRDAAE